MKENFGSGWDREFYIQGAERTDSFAETRMGIRGSLERQVRLLIERAEPYIETFNVVVLK